MSFRSGGPDVALRQLPGGRLDLVIDGAGPNRGNVRFDRSAAHALFTRVVARKGRYYWDPSGQRGTRLLEVKDDRTGTPSKLQAAVEDGCAQVQALPLLTTYQVAVTKPGRNYQIAIAWSVPGSSAPQNQVLSL